MLRALMLRAWGLPEALMVLLPVVGSWRWMLLSGGVVPRAECVSEGEEEDGEEGEEGGEEEEEEEEEGDGGER